MATFQWDAPAGNAALAAFGQVPEKEPIRSSRATFGQGIMSALVNAEMYAVKNGVVSGIKLANGETAYPEIGAARDRILSFPTEVQDPYLAMHRAAYLAQQNARDAGAGAGGVPLNVAPTGSSDEVGIAPLIIIGLVVVGIAAVIGGYFAYTESRQSMVDGLNLRELARVDALTKLAMTGKLTPDAAKAISAMAAAEREDPSGGGLPWWGKLAIGVGAGAVAVGGGIWVAKRIAKSGKR